MKRLGRWLVPISVSAVVVALATAAMHLHRAPGRRHAVPTGHATLPTGLGPLHPPLPDAPVQSVFGWAERAGRPAFQPYVVFSAPPGVSLQAIAAGTVSGIHDDPRTLGLYVEVEHAGGWSSQYGRCVQVAVVTGQAVVAGTPLCSLDPSAGAAFSLRLDRHPVNPGPYLGLGG